MAKKNEFNFDKRYEDIKSRISKAGRDNDIVVNTMLVEFKRMKDLCDRLSQKIESNEVIMEAIGSMGQKTLKTYPLIQDYNKCHACLVRTCSEIENLLKDIPDEITTKNKKKDKLTW